MGVLTLERVSYGSTCHRITCACHPSHVMFTPCARVIVLYPRVFDLDILERFRYTNEILPYRLCHHCFLGLRPVADG